MQPSLKTTATLVNRTHKSFLRIAKKGSIYNFINNFALPVQRQTSSVKAGCLLKY